MPTTKSSKKRLRQNIVRRQRNRTVKSSIRTRLRKVREAVGSGDLAKAEQEFRLTAKELDKAGARNVIHRNKAARTKSRLQRLIRVAKQGVSKVAESPSSPGASP